MVAEMENEIIDFEKVEKEKAMIEDAFVGLMKAIKVKISEEDRVNIHKAYEMAVEAHSEQRRKSGEPYILHPIAVARICAEEIGLGPTAIICALLHDVVEDTPITLDEIRDHFGSKVTNIVDGLTKLDSASNADSPQAENFKKVLATLVDDVRVILIKMADRLHNMRTLGFKKKSSQMKIAAETNYIYAPLAHRLGLFAIKTEFQDLCMKVMEPEKYKEIAKGLQETKAARQAYIESFIAFLSPKLDELGINYRIYGRPKSIYSIYNKVKNKSLPLNEIYDLFAIRIIILDVPRKREKTACWEIFSTVTDVFQQVSDRFKDYMTNPKSNGYESLHSTVIGLDGRFVEVQIRSERMDEIAEKGFAAHWKYKGVDNNSSNLNVSQSNDVYEKWIAETKFLLDSNSGDPVEFLSDFKSNLTIEDVHAYTPKGDVIVLPKGATALDFAFAIHSEVGGKCNGVKVDGVGKPFSYELQNGDIIEIATSKNQKPNDSWLKILKTGKAKSRVRQLLKEEKKQQGSFGKEVLQRKLEHLKVDFESNVDMLIKHFGFKTRLDFYFALSLEQVNLKELKRFKIDGNKLVEVEIPKGEKQQVSLKDIGAVKKYEGKPRLIINNQPGEQYEYSLATCCNPIPGDDVFAYLTTGSGMRIHRLACNNAENLHVNYSYRILSAEWVYTPNANFIADIIITGVDTGVGVIEKLAHNISVLGLSMAEFKIGSKDEFFTADVKLKVNNRDQMYLAIRALKKLEGVQNVLLKEE